MNNVFVLLCEEYDIDDIVNGHPVAVKVYAKCVYNTAGAAHNDRCNLMSTHREMLDSRGYNVRVSDSTTHLIYTHEDGAEHVLYRYTIQRCEFIKKTAPVIRAKGRRKTSGKFDTREQLEEYVLHRYFTTPMKIAEIARASKVSPTVVDRIVNEHGPSYRKDNNV